VVVHLNFWHLKFIGATNLEPGVMGGDAQTEGNPGKVGVWGKDWYIKSFRKSWFPEKMSVNLRGIHYFFSDYH